MANDTMASDSDYDSDSDNDRMDGRWMDGWLATVTRSHGQDGQRQ